MLTFFGLHSIIAIDETQGTLAKPHECWLLKSCPARTPCQGSTVEKNDDPLTAS